MKHGYCRIDLRNVEGFKRAERLQRNGWTIYSSSPDVLLMKKPTAASKILREIAESKINNKEI